MFPHYFVAVDLDCKVKYDGVGGRCGTSFYYCNFGGDDLELSNCNTFVD